MSDRNVPKLRFSEFTDNWEDKKIKDILQVKHGKSQKAVEDNFGEYPILATGGKIGRTNQFLHDRESVLIGRKGTIDRPIYINEPFWTIDTLFYTEIDLKNYNAYWIYNSFLKINWYQHNEASGVPSLSANNIESIKITTPSKKEQDKIAVFFKILDKNIKAKEKEIKKKKKIKDAYLTEMFPNGKHPKRRFKGFTEPWKTKKLGLLVDIETGKLDANAMVENGRYDFYTSGIKKYKINVPAFEGPAITIAGNGATVGYMHLADGKFNAYQRTYVLTNFEAIREFLYLEISRKLPVKIQQEARMGNIPYIVMDMLASLEINLPSIEEQYQIANFFMNLDMQLSIENEKLKKLKKIKQAYLQAMFI